MTEREELNLYLRYEIIGNGWAEYVGWEPLQRLIAWYYAKKTLKRYKRLKKNKVIQNELFQLILKQRQMQ